MMTKLKVEKNAYYQNQWEHKGYLITELTDVSYPIWKDNEVIKCCISLAQAQAYIDTLTDKNAPQINENMTEEKITASELQNLIKIAQENIPSLENRQDLESHQSDDEDFFDISVWCLKDALIAAYELGKATGKAVKTDEY